MTWEMWLALAVVAVPGTLSLIGQLSGIWAAKDSNVISDASKLTGSALAMVTGLEKRIERLSFRIEQQDAKLDKQDVKMDKQDARMAVYQSYIQYLWMVVVKLTNQLEEAGIEPAIKPDRQFRGDDDMADIEWEWLDE